MLESVPILICTFLWRNSMANIDYNEIIKEIDGINPADNEDGLMQTYSAERLVEIQTELSSVEPADRNDDHQLAWLGLYDKANALIGELAGQSLEGIRILPKTNISKLSNHNQMLRKALKALI